MVIPWALHARYSYAGSVMAGYRHVACRVVVFPTFPSPEIEFASRSRGRMPPYKRNRGDDRWIGCKFSTEFMELRGTRPALDASLVIHS